MISILVPFEKNIQFWNIIKLLTGEASKSIDIYGYLILVGLGISVIPSSTLLYCSIKSAQKSEYHKSTWYYIIKL